MRLWLDLLHKSLGPPPPPPRRYFSSRCWPAARGPARSARPGDRPAAAVRSVRVPKAGEMVAAQLRRQIVLGELKEGDQLRPRPG